MPSNAELANQVSEFVDRQRAMINSLRDWAIGTATGGPSANGYYTITLGPGETYSIPSPARIAVDANSYTGETLTGPGTFTMTTAHVGKIMRIGNGSLTANISVVLGNLPLWSQIMFEQVGSGRLLFSAAGGSTNFLHRQGYTRSAGLGAVCGAVCERVTSGVSHWCMFGDMSTTTT